MCKLFIQADPALWESQTRSLRIDGVVTSIRLENAFWKILDEIAARDKLTLPSVITRLYHESVEQGHNLNNFTSFLRVCCSRYLSLQLNGLVPEDPDIAIADLDAEDILSKEAALWSDSDERLAV